MTDRPSDANGLVDASKVLSVALSMLDRFSVDDFQRQLFRDILDHSPALSAFLAHEPIMAIHLPFLIYRAVGGHDEEQITTLAATLILLETGIYTLDHLVDRELTGPLAERPKAVVLTGAVCFISYLPRMAIRQLTCDASTRSTLRHLLDQGLANISQGQLLDVSFNVEQPPTAAEVELSVAGKTGARRALYARMGATLGHGSASQVENYAAFAKALGIARQINSDVIDLFSTEISRDIAAGTVTLPIAIFLETVDPAGREEMIRLVIEGRKNPSLIAAVRKRLRDSGALRQTLLRKESMCALALKYLHEAAPPFPVALMLSELIEAVSLRRSIDG